MKVCNICRKEKELCDFNIDNTRKGGVSYRCKKCVNEYYKEYHINNREKLLSLNKEYYINNKEKIKEYNINNREKRKSYHKEYQRNRKLNDPIFKLIKNVRSRLRQYLKSAGITKSNRTFDIVGCSPPELKEHLERQFVDGMSWNKMGKEIHIDHIIPLSSADNEDEIYKLCHYSNLQPLWAEDNLSKGNKIPHDYDWSDEFDANKVVGGGVKV